MKKILLYLAIAIIVVCCGVSIYYVVRNDENIYSTVDSKDKIYMNLNETIDIPVVHERPNKNTKLEVECESDCLEIDTDKWEILAVKPGVAKITVTSSNENFGSFEYIITVGNGSSEFPYYIRNAEDLSNIGKENWSLNDNYELTDDINLEGEIFTPIGSSTEHFNGTLNGTSDFYSIKNLYINPSEDCSDSVGLFATIGENGRVENLKITNANVISSEKFTGIVAGRNYGLIGKCIIENGNVSSVSSEKEEQVYSGLVCGLNERKNQEARISLNTVSGSLNASYTSGGIVGKNVGGTIDNNDIEITNIQKSNGTEKVLAGGIAGFTMNVKESTKCSKIFNNLVKIIDYDETNVDLGGIFGETLVDSLSAKGYYSTLIYNSDKLISAVVINKYDSVLTSDTSSAINYCVNATRNEILSKNIYTDATSSTWNFSGIWHFEVEKDIYLDYENENFDYQVLPITGDVIEISSRKTLISALDNMRNNPSADVTYKITGEATISENGEVEDKIYTYTIDDEWIAIGTKDEPFCGRIIADENVYIQIKGKNDAFIESDFAGLFAYVSKDAYISNIKLSNFEISGIMAGGIVANNGGAKIENCSVINTTIETTKYAGAICGYSVGSIINCSAENNSIILNSGNERNLYLGGLVGKIRGSILNSTLKNISVNVTLKSSENTLCVGGIVGYIDNGNISNSEALSINVSSYEYTGKTYCGGAVGYAVSSFIKSVGVSKDDTNSTLSISTSNENSFIGGIAGLMYGGEVERCAVSYTDLSGYYSAGLVSFCEGDITESYAGTTVALKGNYVSGLTNNLHGDIDNCYTLVGLEGKNVETGLTTYLWEDGNIEHCFTYCSYKGDGESYVETYSNYKSNDDFGNIENTVFVGDLSTDTTIKDWYESNRHIICADGIKRVKIQVYYFHIKGNDFKSTTEEGLIGESDAWEVFKTLNFDENIWNFESGKSPYLKSVYDLGETASNVFEKEEEEISEDVEEESEEDIA